MQLQELTLKDEEKIKQLISSAFAVEPWNDDWHNEENFHRYITDIMGNDNSVALGLMDGDTLVGLSLGHLKHWFNGIEYCIDDFCISPVYQGQGLGSRWVQLVKAYSQQHGFDRMALKTKRQAAAFHFYLKNGFQEITDDVYLELKCSE